MDQALRVLIVEDEILLQMQLELYLEDAGHRVAGVASSAAEVRQKADLWKAELALVDVQLADGPTGIEVAQELSDKGLAVVFMTGNAQRIPPHFSGAIGVIGKPYTQEGVSAALEYLLTGVRHPPPTLPLPSSLVLSRRYARDWSRD